MGRVELASAVLSSLTPPTEQSDQLVEAVRARAVFWCRAAGDALGLDPNTETCEEAIEADGFPHQAGPCPYWQPIGTDGGCPPIETDDTMGDTMDADAGEPDMMDTGTGDEIDVIYRSPVGRTN